MRSVILSFGLFLTGCGVESSDSESKETKIVETQSEEKAEVPQLEAGSYKLASVRIRWTEGDEELEVIGMPEAETMTLTVEYLGETQRFRIVQTGKAILKIPSSDDSTIGCDEPVLFTFSLEVFGHMPNIEELPNCEGEANSLVVGSNMTQWEDGRITHDYTQRDGTYRITWAK